MISIHNLTFQYPTPLKDRPFIFQNLSLQIPMGEFVSFVGPSGSGKSTLLRLISGLEQPSSAQEIQLPFQKSQTGKIGFVFQSPELLPWRTVIQNIALPLELGAHGDPHAAMDIVGLTKAQDLYPRQLSGGMAMRVSLARAIATPCELLLLDEPFAALDEPLRERLSEDVLALHKKRKLTSVLVTHSIQEAVYLSHRIFVFNQFGKLVEEISNSDFPPRGSEALFKKTRDISTRISHLWGKI